MVTFIELECSQKNCLHSHQTKASTHQTKNGCDVEQKKSFCCDVFHFDIFVVDVSLAFSTFRDGSQ